VDGRTYVHTDGHLRLALLVRLRRVDLKKKMSTPSTPLLGIVPFTLMFTMREHYTKAGVPAYYLPYF